MTCIYAPLEVYALNSEEFWFTLGDLLYIVFACGIVAMLFALVLSFCFRGKVLKAYEGILFGVGVAFYIQGNFLGLKLGSMTGGAPDWSLYQLRFILNMLIWCGLIIGMIAWNIKSKKYADKIIPSVSTFLSLVQLVTLIVLIIPHLGEDKTPACGYPTDKDIMSLSSNENVIVFVLDKYDNQYFKELLQKEPELKSELDGFTYYSNTTGCYCFTKYAIPFLLSGKFCYQGDVEAWKAVACEEEVYWDAAIQNDWEMSVYTASLEVPERVGENAINFVKTKAQISDRKRFTMALYQLVMCKYFPDIVKPYIWLKGYEFDNRKTLNTEYKEWTVNNLALVDLLQEEKVTTDKIKPQYKFIHVSGAHEPYEINSEGYRDKENANHDTVVRGSLMMVVRYMKQLKELGIYDSSAIIITADHGDFSSEPTCPIFMVKPMDKRGEMKTSEIPVSHQDFGATLLQLMGLKEESLNFGTSVFDISENSNRKRKFYLTLMDQKDATGKTLERLVEYVALPEGNDPDDFVHTGIVYDYDGNRIEESE